jgi:hypothetical protein
MNDTANYLGQQRWRVRASVTGTGSTTLKNCPSPQGTVFATGTADAGGTTTTMVDAPLIGATGMVGRWIKFTGATTNKNLVRKITAFDTTTGTATFAPAVNAATGVGDTYDIWIDTTVFNHLVITGYSFSGSQTGGAFGTAILRHIDGNKEVLVGAVIAPTAGVMNKDNSNCWYEMIPNQNLELVVGGTFSGGSLDVTVEGRILPMSTTSTDFLDGAAH